MTVLVIFYMSCLECEGQGTLLDTATREWFRAGDFVAADRMKRKTGVLYRLLSR
jgi:hypothetical protein